MGGPNGALATKGSRGDGDWSGGDGGAIGTRGQSNTGGRGNGDSDTESLDGMIAIFRAYQNGILTAEEVQANYDAVAIPGSPIRFSDLGVSNVTTSAAIRYGDLSTNVTSTTLVGGKIFRDPALRRANPRVHQCHGGFGGRHSPGVAG